MLFQKTLKHSLLNCCCFWNKLSRIWWHVRQLGDIWPSTSGRNITLHKVAAACISICNTSKPKNNSSLCHKRFVTRENHKEPRCSHMSIAGIWSAPSPNFLRNTSSNVHSCGMSPFSLFSIIITSSSSSHHYEHHPFSVSSFFLLLLFIVFLLFIVILVTFFLTVVLAISALKDSSLHVLHVMLSAAISGQSPWPLSF